MSLTVLPAWTLIMCQMVRTMVESSWGSERVEGRSKRAPNARDYINAGKNMEYTAPILGEKFSELYDQAYHRSKASHTLKTKQKQMTTFKPLRKAQVGHRPRNRGLTTSLINRRLTNRKTEQHNQNKGWQNKNKFSQNIGERRQRQVRWPQEVFLTPLHWNYQYCKRFPICCHV